MGRLHLRQPRLAPERALDGPLARPRHRLARRGRRPDRRHPQEPEPEGRAGMKRAWGKGVESAGSTGPARSDGEARTGLVVSGLSVAYDGAAGSVQVLHDVGFSV